MGQVAVFNPGNLPAFVKQHGLSAVAKALAGGGGMGGKRVSIKGGVFRLIADGKEVAAIEERHLDVVIVNAAPKVARTFYLKQYDSENPSAPDCWSADGTTPDATATNKQASSCAACPKNVKGSGQGDSRACRFSQQVAVVLANDIEGDVLKLSLPAQSIFGKAEGENRPLQEYARWLSAQGIDPTMLVTRLKFDTRSESPKLFFKAMRWLEDHEFKICQTQGSSEDAIKAVTMTVAQMDNAPPPPVEIPGKRPAAAAPAPAPQVDEDDEPPPPAPKAKAKPKAAPAPEPVAEVAAEVVDDEPPPVVRAAKAPAPAAGNSNLASALDAWDD
jgi:hypothetical protein